MGLEGIFKQCESKEDLKYETLCFHMNEEMLDKALGCNIITQFTTTVNLSLPVS